MMINFFLRIFYSFEVCLKNSIGINGAMSRLAGFMSALTVLLFYSIILYLLFEVAPFDKRDWKFIVLVGLIISSFYYLKNIFKHKLDIIADQKKDLLEQLSYKQIRRYRLIYVFINVLLILLLPVYFVFMGVYVL
jgi:hypothetical protein